MSFFIVLQVLVDIGLLYLIFRSLLNAKKTTPVVDTAAGAAVDVTQWEESLKSYKARFEESLKTLHSICEQANRILHQNKSATTVRSREETELKEVGVAKTERNKIPSLEQIETTRQRLKSDIPIDLKTLLKDQLS